MVLLLSQVIVLLNSVQTVFAACHHLGRGHIRRPIEMMIVVVADLRLTLALVQRVLLLVLLMSLSLVLSLSWFLLLFSLLQFLLSLLALLLLLLLASAGGRRLISSLLLFQLSFEFLFHVHLHVALLLIAPGKFPVASITTERLLARMSPLVCRQMVTSAEGARALLIGLARNVCVCDCAQLRARDFQREKRGK